MVLYAAAWAHTFRAAREQRTAEARRAPGAALATEHAEHPEQTSGGTQHGPGRGGCCRTRDGRPVRRTSAPEAAGHRADKGVRSWRALAGAGVLALVGAAADRGFRGGGVLRPAPRPGPLVASGRMGSVKFRRQPPSCSSPSPPGTSSARAFAKNLAAAHASGEDRPTGYWVAQWC